MNIKIFNKGFTLVELLVVISIIGILAGIFLNKIGDFRDRAQDARRIADIRHVQTVLELYYNKCLHYPNPNSPIDGSCGSSVSVGSVSWETLEKILKSAGLKVKSIPKDPDPAKKYEYGSDGEGYVLKATLDETDNPATKDSPDGTFFGVINCGQKNPPNTGTKKEYCVEF